MALTNMQYLGPLGGVEVVPNETSTNDQHPVRFVANGAAKYLQEDLKDILLAQNPDEWLNVV